MKKTIIISLVVLAVLAVAALVWPRQSSAPQATLPADQPSAAAPTSTSAVTASTTDQAPGQAAPAVSSTTATEPKPSEPAAKPVQPKEPGYTSAEVATHNQFEDCWLIIAGKVYDLTAYLDQHPGGSAVVAAYCGQEATQAFDTKGGEGQHSDAARADLNKYYLGPLK